MRSFTWPLPTGHKLLLFIWYFILQQINCEISYLVRNFHGQEWKLNKVIMHTFIECVHESYFFYLSKLCKNNKFILKSWDETLHWRCMSLSVEIVFFFLLFCSCFKLDPKFSLTPVRHKTTPRNLLYVKKGMLKVPCVSIGKIIMDMAKNNPTIKTQIFY